MAIVGDPERKLLVSLRKTWWANNKCELRISTRCTHAHLRTRIYTNVARLVWVFWSEGIVQPEAFPLEQLATLRISATSLFRM